MSAITKIINNLYSSIINKLYSRKESPETKKEVSFEVIKIEDPDKCFNKNCLGNRCNVDDEKKDFCYTHYTKYLKELEEENQNNQEQETKTDQQS